MTFICERTVTCEVDFKAIHEKFVRVGEKTNKLASKANPDFSIANKTL